MAEVTVTIGGRDFEVACQNGEEAYLRSAAGMLDREASVLIGQIGRIPEVKMLLMSGLMLADRTAAVEDEIAAMRVEMTKLQAELAEARANVTQVEVPVLPPEMSEALAEIAARAEALADNIEDVL
ncbi:cell division protein ZapA [Thioclava sp. GXIMD4216]|uniref:Cell division protein ZapA n=1 Tax=Thioclava litoralis TaxID=3076557 RepID=A0ABZ1E261_9RHOB|nr:cell division protein ZapA [Thioclava sp. FTW29]